MNSPIETSLGETAAWAVSGSHKLILRVDDAWLDEHPVKATVVVGRAPDCDVLLDHHEVSRHHLVIEATESGSHTLRDLGSTNGTFVNGRVVSAKRLEEGDRITIGNAELIYASAHADTRELQEDTARFRQGCLLESSESDRDPGDEALREQILALSLESTHVHCERELGPLLDAVLHELLRYARHDRGCVLLVDEDGPLEAAALRTLAGQPAVIEPSAADLETALQSLRDRRVTARYDDVGGAPSVVCLPMGCGVPTALESTKQQSIPGVFLLLGGAAPRSLARHDRRLLELLAVQAGAAVRRTRLVEQATTDHLTGLANRATMEGFLQEGLDRARKQQGALAVAVLDIDHFKQVNDALGHDVGDEVLKACAARICAALRKGDPVARWGGEEFLALLSAEDLEGAQAAVEKVKQLVAAEPIAGCEVTVSIGVASYPTHGASVERLVRAADVALYAAKSRGRNQVATYSTELEHALTPEPAPRSADDAGGVIPRTTRILRSEALGPRLSRCP